jgi:hypothetical protein
MTRSSTKARSARSARPLSRSKTAKRLPVRSSVASKAAIIVRPPDRKPWLLQPEEITILKNAICKGASEDELKYCLAVARRYSLDPFQQQIWFVPRWDSEAQRTDGAKGAKLYVPVVGINGMLHIAARDHKDFGTYSEPEYGPMVDVKWQYKGSGPFKALKVPEWARIEAHKKGCPEPTVAKVWWNEIYPDIDYAPLVRRMPRLMLAKCAKAQATRTSYPSTGGLLIPEETHSREFTDITPGGRLIVHEKQPADLEAAVEAADQNNPHLKSYEEKEREALSKIAETATPHLSYTLHKEIEMWEIDGPQELKHEHRDLLLPLFDKKAGKIMAKPEDFGRLMNQFEIRGVPFKEKQVA